MSLRTTAVAVSLSLPGLFLVSAASGDVNELLGRVPGQANAIVAVDAAFVGAGDSATTPAPVAKPRSPVPLPKVAGLKSLVLAARVHPGTMEPAWEVALMEVGQKPSMQTIATSSGGYMDTAAGKPAAVNPNDVLCVEISDSVLGAVYPADRQFATRWLGANGAGAGPQDYLRNAVAGVGSETPVVIAIDLADTVSEAAVRRMLEMDQPKWAASLGGDKAAAVLASVRGVTIRIGMLGADGAAGTMVIDFAQDATPLGAAAGAIVTGVMAERGVSVPDLARWQFTASGRTLTGNGRLSIQGIERLVDFLSPPAVAAPAGPAEARTAAANESAAGKQAAAAASRTYYKTVSGILDAFRAGESLSDSAAWLNRSARRIDQLPGTDVDPDLLLWGADVSSKLREAGSILSAGQQRVRARNASVQTSVGYAGTGGSNESQRAAEARAQRENLRRQAAQLAAEERANVQLEASKPLEAAMDSRGKIRAAMAERYGSGF